MLLDWRGTLVVAPTNESLVQAALVDLGRNADPAAIEVVLDQLDSADASEVESSAIDTDADVHRRAYAAWFHAAGLDEDLAAALYAAECNVAANSFARDVGPLLVALHATGVRIGVLSDIHVDLRPVFAAQTASDGRTWADLVHAWVLSFEVGAAKPDPVIFEAGLERLGLPAEDVLMVGDRGAWDGAAAESGITTLVLPPLRSVDDLRLQRVLDLVQPAAVLTEA